MGYKSHAQRKAVWASKKDGGKGNPNKSPAKMGPVAAMVVGKVAGKVVDKAMEKSPFKLDKNKKKSDTLYLPNKFKKHQNKMIDETDYEKISKKNKKKYNRVLVEDLQDMGKIKLNKQDKPYVVNKASSPFQMKAKSPLMGKISASCKARAKKKFKVWPSAYASGWGVRCTQGKL